MKPVRAARAIVFSREGGDLVGYNYLRGKSFVCSADLLQLLTAMDDWTTATDAQSVAGWGDPEAFAATLGALTDMGALVERDSEAATTEERHLTAWNWGLPAALFHCSLQNRPYMPLEEAEARQLARAASDPPGPALYLHHEDRPDRTDLPGGRGASPVLDTMAARRTNRTSTGEPIRLKDLSDCLFAGLGITGATTNCVGELPLGMTPSGGARNPYEGYVYAREVQDLRPGFYHYSAVGHSLAPIPSNRDLPRASDLLGGQDWADDMPCTIILQANFERTMWKYDDANAYRVVMIEAGHIGQNVMLAATERGLTACPTAALNHDEISTWIGVEPAPERAPVYALTLSRPVVN